LVGSALKINNLEIEYILKVPNTARAEDWVEFVRFHVVKNIKSTKLIVDFQDIKFLETDDIVMLTSVIEYIYLENSKCDVEFINGSNNLNVHLHNINFKKFWNDEFNRNELINIGNSNTISLWQIKEEYTFSYLQKMREFFEYKFFNNKDLSDLTSNLDEVFNNIFDHSSSKVNGFIIGQYFPKPNTLSFSICDLGIGIPTRINLYNISENKEALSDSEAIFKSLERGVTTKTSQRNKGFGLNNILQLTESSNGELRIYSNNGYLIKNANESFEYFDLKYYFPGTIIRIEIDANSFETLSIKEDIFDFNDF
jgi:anti-sigma regulatory factor (Ser/Thr protein kinase)